MFLVYHDRIPLAFSKTFTRIQTVHLHCTKNSSTFYRHQTSSNIIKLTLSINGPVVWDSIPDSYLKLLSSVENCKCWFKNIYYCSKINCCTHIGFGTTKEIDSWFLVISSYFFYYS